MESLEVLVKKKKKVTWILRPIFTIMWPKLGRANKPPFFFLEKYTVLCQGVKWYPLSVKVKFSEPLTVQNTVLLKYLFSLERRVLLPPFLSLSSLSSLSPLFSLSQPPGQCSQEFFPELRKEITKLQFTNSLLCKFPNTKCILIR